MIGGLVLGAAVKVVLRYGWRRPGRGSADNALARAVPGELASRWLFTARPGALVITQFSVVCR
jgi:hypothetical protein